MRMIRVGAAQINTTVGDLAGNTSKMTEIIKKAKDLSIDILTFPELAITGYPPKDLLLKRKFIQDNIQMLDKICNASKGIIVIAGFVNEENDIFNSAAVIQNGKIVGIQNKIHLPNYSVFDEKRYFRSGKESLLFKGKNMTFGVNICEDIWIPGYPTENQASSGAELIINISASPYHVGKPAFREEMLKTRCTDNIVALVFNNLVGGQDDLVFDGRSMIINCKGEILRRGKLFEEDLIMSDINLDDIKRMRLQDPRGREELMTPDEHKVTIVNIDGKISSAKQKKRIRVNSKAEKASGNKISRAEEIYKALVLGVSDYLRKNGFKQVILGLSGGIDSSLVATIAVDALGKENVIGIAMPTSISSSHSIEDARHLAKNLSIRFEVVPIQSVFDEYTEILSPLFKGRKWDVAEENIQARIRGNILMALSNKFGYLLLTTGNKSELSVGYATLYGDMAGGLAVISDVPKTWVYELARYRNSVAGKSLIPERCITKPPSAELRPNQKDTDSLPEYEILDQILHLYIEEDNSLEEIVRRGIDEKTARDMIQRIDGNEYKRQQAPPGIRITTKAFGSGRRIPITNKYRG
ncbi:MAG: NAD+ synthase [Candidatus Schekmanbacteria bacterium]|nr:NAD+ synthase [Candidatus Schekmanbacteria bacterium]